VTTPGLESLTETALIGAITNFLSDRDPQILGSIRAALHHEVEQAGPEALAHLGGRLAEAGADWIYYPPDPLARRIHHVLAEQVLPAESVLTGVEHVTALAGSPVVIVANHLSYSDANLVEVLLYRSAATEMSDRLSVIAGPKVYSNLKRRFSSLCFGTVKTPQSSALSSEDAVMTPREVARAARRAIESAHERLAAGDALLVFAEGTRSRTNGLQQMLTAVTRYFEQPGVWLLPVGIAGSEAMFPIGDDTLYSVPVVARAGRPLLASTLQEQSGGDRRLMIDAVALAVAQVLPSEYRGAYAEGVEGLDAARQLLAGL
jgi:1-acyl-sn-glycerol-3-phosphate acyltransferase